MSRELAAALDHAYEYSEPEERISAIKLAVGRQLERVDHGASVRHTEYFNNSMAPDLVLRWPSENRERLVFLRPHSSSDWLPDDLEWITSTHPLVITLDSSRERADLQRYAEVKQKVYDSDTLVADPQAVGELSERVDDEPAANLIAQAVLRGGRGLIDAESARTAVDDTVEGFHGAERVDLAATRRATLVLSEILQDEQAGRLGRVLQSVWEGHGGRIENFPGARNLSGEMTDEDLHFLLVNVPTGSAEFWRRIGRGVKAAQIARLKLDDFSVNLQSLISANSSILLVRGIRVLHEQRMLDEDPWRDRPLWTIAKGCISLRGAAWTAYLATGSIQDLPRKTLQDGPSISELRTRADRWMISVSNLELDTGDRIIAYSSKGDEDVLHDSRLSRITQADRARVRRSTIALPGGGRLECDFTSLTASGHTSAVFSLGDVVRSALPLLVDIDELESDFLEALARIEEASAGGEQGSLF